MSLYLIIINALGLLFMLADKKRAIRHQWRYPEALLLLVALAGGSIGVFAGMLLAWHKVRKPAFFFGLPLILILQLLLYFALA